MTKIGIVTHNGPQFGAGFRVYTNPSEQEGMTEYGFDVVLRNGESPLVGATVYVFYRISGTDERAVEKNPLHGSPFTTDETGTFTIDGGIPSDLVERTSFVVEHGSARTIFSLCNRPLQLVRKLPPPDAGVHTSTKSHQVSGTIGGDGAVQEEVGDDQDATAPITGPDDGPSRENTARYSMTTLEPKPDRGQEAPPPDQAPKEQNKPHDTPGFSEVEMRLRLCRLLGFAGTVDIRQLLDKLENDIDERTTRKEVTALVDNQMALAMRVVIDRILHKVGDTIDEHVAQGLDAIAQAQNDTEEALGEEAERIATRVAGQIVWRIRKQQASSHLQKAWHWIARVGRKALILAAITSLLLLYYALVTR